MIGELCNWAYEVAAGWIPEWIWPEQSEGGAAPATEEISSTPAPATVAALSRAREALAAIERSGAAAHRSPDGPRRDARFRPSGTAASGEPGIERLVVRLNEVDVAGLARADREALRGAAEHLVRRLQSPRPG